MRTFANYPTYNYSKKDIKSKIAQLVWLDSPGVYPFDEYHAHNYYEIFVFSKGGGVHNINFNEHLIKDNSIHVLAANHLHRLERGVDSKGFVILFKEVFLQKLSFFHPQVHYLDIFSCSKVINLSRIQKHEFGYLFKELKNNKENSIYLLNIIGAFLTKVALTFRMKEASGYSYDKLTYQLLLTMNKYYKEHFTVEKYAALLNTSTSNLRRKVKKHTGKTIPELQEERLLKEAKRLLYHPDLTIGEIAYQLGFKQPAQFSTWFKKNVHVSPSHYIND